MIRTEWEADAAYFATPAYVRTALDDAMNDYRVALEDLRRDEQQLRMAQRRLRNQREERARRVAKNWPANETFAACRAQELRNALRYREHIEASRALVEAAKATLIAFDPDGPRRVEESM